MNNLYSIRPKSKVAITLLSMVVLMLCGVLAERYIFSRIKEASTSIVKDRLIPSTAIYHLSDHFTQRKLALADTTYKAGPLRQHLHWHRAKEDSIIEAFEKTYLVEDEALSLGELKAHLSQYNQLEQQFLNGASTAEQLNSEYNLMREELLELSNIQTRVGQKLQTENERLTSNADVISQILVIVIIVCCLVAQGFVLASKSIIPSIKQKHNLN
jgi:hypothetical protein